MAQQLRDDADGDELRFLAGNAFDADRAGHAGDRGRIDAALLEAVDEALPLRLRADQAEVGEIATPQHGLGDAQVEVVVVGQHEVESLRRCEAHLGFDRVDADLAHVWWPWCAQRGGGGELGLAFVDPVDLDIERGQQGGDGAADVAGAVELQVEEWCCGRPVGEGSGVERGVPQGYRATAALAEGGAEREVLGVGCVSSVASSVTGVPNRFAYGASKAAVLGITKSVAGDFVARGIRCNAICPGTVESPSLRDRVRAQAEATGRRDADVLAEFQGRQPMGRLGRPDEIAMLAVYLASDESAFTTGTVAVVDGGWTN